MTETSAMRQPRPPIVIDRLFDDPGFIADLVTRGGPYWTVQRYLSNLAELSALSDAGRVADQEPGRPRPSEMGLIAPWFRGNWAEGDERVAGVERILEEPRLKRAAATLFGGTVVVPTIAYANLTCPMPGVDPGHVDVPAFRGIDRSEHPVWLLVTMLKSGLFERWYIPTATAVAWFYEGVGGGFTYWPDGPDAPPVKRPCISNSAVIGDNEHMFHRVSRVGGSDQHMLTGLTLDSTLERGDGGWVVREGDRILAQLAPGQVRLSVSWKAHVFADQAAFDLVEGHTRDLTLDQVIAAFVDDLRQRDVEFTLPDDPLVDPSFVQLLADTYRVTPTVYK